MEHKYTVGEFKARFSEALQAVEEGETVMITYGRAKRTVAMLTPPKPVGLPRQLGRHKGKFTARMVDDWKLDDEGFLDS